MHLVRRGSLAPARPLLRAFPTRPLLLRGQRPAARRAPWAPQRPLHTSAPARAAAAPQEDAEIAVDFEKADLNHDGVLSFEEFRALRQKPSAQSALEMPRDYWEMSNEVLLMMSARGVAGASRERMVRDVMAVEGMSWQQAQPVVEEIAQSVTRGLARYESPYYVGAGLISVSAALSVPMVFNLQLADWFFERFVTGEHPPSKELETWLEVGGWTWNWMEPVIGTLSFLILAAQLTKALLVRVRFSPYYTRVTAWQLKQVQLKYPRYHPVVLEDFVSGVMQSVE